MYRYLAAIMIGSFTLCLSGVVACNTDPEPAHIVATLTPPIRLPATGTPSPSPMPPTPSPTATTKVPPRPTDTPIPIPTLNTAQRLAQVEPPVQNLNELAFRFKHTAGQDQAISAPIRNNFKLGDKDTFWVSDISLERPSQFQITAKVAYLTDHAYWWVQEGYTVSKADLIASAKQFENQTYPTTRAYFGSEWSPGIDNDVRIHILMGNIPGVGGYYVASNEYSQFANEYSNQREMFLINLNALQPGSERFDGLLAHEFQHMIHWNQDPNEDSWLNEGLSELAWYLNGYGLSSFVNLYLNRPDTQLTTWGLEARTTGVNYGYGFLFSAYFLDKFGPEAMTELVAHPGNGITGIEQTLEKLNIATDFKDLFANFIIANYLNDPNLDQGQWGYALPGFNLASPSMTAQHDTFPIEMAATVNQYGVDYIEIIGQQAAPPTDLAITFAGAMTATLLNNQAHQGRYQWYSNRGDVIDTKLTREFDLSGLTQATLKFWAWYDIEANWDYAYVTISTDGGQRWHILPATTTRDDNPVGNAYGAGFTGRSDASAQGAQGAQWIEETIDLTPYVDQKVLLRFEYITDDAVNLPGFAIDDISIPELAYHDDAETAAGGWLAEGFVRTDNILPQWFIVQLIEFGVSGEINITRISLDENNRGDYVLHGLGREIQKTILAISAQSPVTTNRASYTYAITPAN